MIQYEKEKTQAKALFLSGSKATEIAHVVSINVRTIRNWIKSGEWESVLSGESLEQAISKRICKLVAKEDKTEKETNEIDRLFDFLLKNQKVEKLKAETQVILDQSEPTTSAPGESNKRKKKHKKNSIDHITKEDLDRVAKEVFKDYQLEMRDHKYDPKIGRKRFYLKSRQIGLTFYFAWEAFENAVLTGKSQAFISASLAQAEIFKAYICMFASKYFNVELTGGRKIKLSNNAYFYFCSTNPSTVQGINGNLYYDEVFWTTGWDKLSTVAGPIASHKDKDVCYFSTPSVTNHEAYPIWSGEKFNSRKRNKKDFDLSHETLKNGDLGADGMFRQMITIHDAIDKGCDFFDLEELKLDYSELQFDNLFCCKFIDSASSIFHIDAIAACHADRSAWDDYDPMHKRPFGNKRVWIGYDPSRFRDLACMVILAPPETGIGGPHYTKNHRVLEIHRFKNMSADAQAEKIAQMFKRFNVEHIGIDTTGFGIGVYDFLQNAKDRPSSIEAITYNPDVKNKLVFKIQSVVNKKRLLFDGTEQRLTQSFLGVHQTSTKGGAVSYKSKRDKETGHGDDFWALTHALIHEGIGAENKSRRTTVGIAA